MTTPERNNTLGSLLDSLEHAARSEDVSVRDVMQELGERSFTSLILMICLLLVSPLSGIPGMPTVSALIITAISTQALLGRKHLWLPRILLDRSVKKQRLLRAVSWLRRPLDWIDNHSRARWRVLSVGPLRWASLIVIFAVPLTWPFLELLPFVTSFGAGAVALIAFGLLARDGLFLIAGYVVAGGMLTLAIRLLFFVDLS